MSRDADGSGTPGPARVMPARGGPIVERFILIGHWPTSRRTLLASVLLLTLNVLFWYGIHLAEAYAPAGQFAAFDRFMVIWCVGVGLALALSIRPALAAAEARWTAYIFTVIYLAPFAVFVHVANDARVLAYTPGLILFFIIFFDERIGAASLLCAILPILLGAPIFEELGVLEGASTLAAGLPEGSMEFAISALNTLQYQLFLAVVVLSAIAAGARRLQEARLAEAERGLRESSMQIDRINQLIRRYVPAQLAQRIIAGEHHEHTRPERRKLTLFFSDVQGFTDASDELDPEDLAGLLDEYLAEMTAIADRHGATVNQIVGDGMMMFFGAPVATDDRDHALRACRMALEMQRRMRELREAWFRRGLQRPFQIRIGVHTGFASVGDFGSAGRKLYSAIGLQTNLTARIQAHCEPGKVLISHATWALVHDALPCVDKGELQFRGIHYPIRAYELVETT